MTIIAWDGRYLAVDSQGTIGAMRTPGNEIKLRRRITVDQKPVAFAACGRLAYVDPMIDWYMKGAHPKEMPSCKDDDRSLLVVLKGGKAPILFDQQAPYPEPYVYREAWGSNREYAIACIDCGLSAPAAVAMTCQRAVYASGPVLFVDGLDEQLKVQTYNGLASNLSAGLQVE